MNIFQEEPYPSFSEDWDNPQNTVFREFYLRCSPDFAILRQLVTEYMSDKGNEGVTRHRLLHILLNSEHRVFYLHAQKRKYPNTWYLRWKWRCFRLHLHRRFKTHHFQEQVKLCLIAKDAIKRLEENNNK